MGVDDEFLIWETGFLQNKPHDLRCNDYKLLVLNAKAMASLFFCTLNNDFNKSLAFMFCSQSYYLSATGIYLFV